MTCRRGSIALALVLATAMALIPVVPAGAVTGSEAVQLLSQQRIENGIPAGLAERPDWSKACAAHNLYEAQTGEFGHHEDPSSPYYTEEGDWAAAHSVLALGAPSWSYGNPWENAPIHLIQMLGPELAEMGADESHNHTCATTWPGYTRPSPPALTAYSYPGNGVSGVVPAETAAESPFVPGDFVGLPEGTTTGRHLLVFLNGPPPAEWAAVQSASLQGPSGFADLRVIDSTSPEIGAYMPTSSAFLIPVAPLQPNSAYTATVDWSASGEPVLHQVFSFTTGSNRRAVAATGGSRCARYARRAAAQRRLSSALRRKATRLAGSARRARDLRLSRRLLRASVRAKWRARRLSRRAKSCRRALAARQNPSQSRHK